MRTIEISTKTFAAIWALRIDGEETENQILERVLTAPEQNAEIANIEPKVSTVPNHSRPNKYASNKEFEMTGKIRWVDDIVSSLRDLGGEANLNDIYNHVRMKRKTAGRSVTKEYQATIRRTLEDHSSDSANHRAADLFALVGRGIWALR